MSIRNSFVPAALKRGCSLRTIRAFAAPGESLFWAKRPVHFSVQEMLANPVMGVGRRGNNRFANVHKVRGL